MSTVLASAELQARYGALTQRYQRHHSHQRHQRHTSAATSIEATVGIEPTNNTSIELPAEITALITGSDYWVRAKMNRYKKLIREGHRDTLLQLARVAHTKQHPANWFAAVCSKARWEPYTLPYVAKLHAVVQTAERVARRLGTQISRFIYQQIWRGVNVERWAIAAAEIRHDKPGQSREKYFAWLCLHEHRLAL